MSLLQKGELTPRPDRFQPVRQGNSGLSHSSAVVGGLRASRFKAQGPASGRCPGKPMPGGHPRPSSRTADALSTGSGRISGLLYCRLGGN
jgi:hypothetical protein